MTGVLADAPSHHGPSSSSSSSSSVPTYRHLLSKQSLTPINPLRVVAHCDIDAAYAQFDAVRLGVPPEKPLATSQWGGLIAINYPARAFGITRHMNAAEAKRKCPELICAHVATFIEGEDEAGYYPDPKPETHKVSLEPYRRESLKILAIFHQTCETIEKASIDEAYLDLSLAVRNLILERNPELRVFPPSSPLGLDTPLPKPPHIEWNGLGNVIPVMTAKPKPNGDSDALPAEATEETKEEEAENDAALVPPSSSQIEVPSDPQNAWSDYALALGAELMQKCRTAVLHELGYTCSAGVARNKILAKLCSAWRKPNAQTILRNDAIPGFLRPLKFTKIRSMGGKLGQVIAAEYDAATVGDLWEVSLRDFQNRIGSEAGSWLYNVLRGVELGEVAAKTAVKSMLSSKSFRPCLTTFDEAAYWMRIIATDLYARLKEGREITPGIWPKTITFGLRDDRMLTPNQTRWQTRHKQTNFPMTANLTVDYISGFGERLLKEFMSERNDKWRISIMSLSFSGLERVEKGQKGIQRFFGANGNNIAGIDRGSPAPSDSEKLLGKRKQSEEVVDLTLGDPTSEAEPIDNLTIPVNNANGEAGQTLLTDDEDEDDDLLEVQPTGPVFKCPRCNGYVSITPLPGEQMSTATVRVEKAHIAKHIQADSVQAAARSTMTKKPSTKKRKGQQKLKSFFTKA